MQNVYDICAAHEIPENGAKGFSIETGAGNLDLLIVRKNSIFYGYINRCPHTGVNLEWQPDRFLNPDGDLIQCSTHGAQFRIADGFCIFGPCAGRSLSALDLMQEKNRIKLVDTFLNETGGNI